ncbi:MAG: MSMEG_3727 family PQQ-associated protein [Gemmatimonadota bacterium]
MSAVVVRLDHKRGGMKRVLPTIALILICFTLSACEYVKLLRPNVLKQLNPRVVRMVNYLPKVDDPNEAIVARLFAHGGLSHADELSDSVFRQKIRVPRDEYMWYPAIVVMKRSGTLELEFHNEDQATHIAFLPSDGEREVLQLPVQTAGRARLKLSQPGLYWIGCPVSNHAGRGMLGLIIVEGEVPADARLDRPRQRRN